MILVVLLLNEFIGAGDSAGFLPIFLCTVFVTPVQVIGDIAAEQNVLLRYITDDISQAVEIVVLDVNAVNDYITEESIVKSGNQLNYT